MYVCKANLTYNRKNMEKLLQYLWLHRILPLGTLYSTDGEEVEIIDPGVLNRDAGPDFFNAKIKINGILWVGQVEIHTHSSLWTTHGHNKDINYDSVILHVANHIDCPLKRTNGERIPQLQLPCTEQMIKQYRSLCKGIHSPRCAAILPRINKIEKISWFNRLQIERLQMRTTQIHERLALFSGDWSACTFITIARSFGFGLNGDAFEQWARMLNLNAVNKHINDPLQVESIFLGQAGLLEEDIRDDDYYQKLQKEYAYLAHKFTLKHLDPNRWKLMRIRPYNFPPLRIAQLAHLYCQRQGLLSQIIEAPNIAAYEKILQTGCSSYWETHFTFGTTGQQSQPSKKHLTSHTIHLICINAIAPLLFAYGQYIGDELMCEKAHNLLESLPAENNYIIRDWSKMHLEAQNAGDTQALIHLHKEYCLKKRCLYCRFGYFYLKGHTENY